MTSASAGRAQHNWGAGTFVGGHNYGTIESLDPATKAILAKLSKQAPDLARLMEQALHDGVISPEVAFALQRAAWSLNEDLAAALLRASDRLNEDVANSLFHSSERLNEDAADRFDRAATDFGMRATDLDRVADRLGAVHTRLHAETERIVDVFTPPEPVYVLDWDKLVRTFVTGLVIGAAAMAAVIYMATH